jgi:uncharacterized membrane protein YkvA (DUF1232 family)
MVWWQVALLAVVVTVVVLLVSALLVWRLTSGRTKRLARRIGSLSWRAKFDLAKRLWTDDRIPLPIRSILPLLVLYLALPLDLIPDFIPVIGQLDDVLVVVIGLALLVRFVPAHLLDQHLSDLEPAIEGAPRERLEGPRPG